MLCVTAHDGASVEQPENGDKLDEVQKAFAACGAFQCGFCTPGFVLMSRHLLDDTPDPSVDEASEVRIHG